METLQAYAAQAFGLLIFAIVVGVVAWIRDRNKVAAGARKSLLDSILDSIADTAVKETEEKFVAPFKEQQVEKRLPAKLTPSAQVMAQKSAEHLVQTTLIETGIDALMVQWPALGELVRAAHERMQQRLPQATKDAFPVPKLIIAFLIGAGLISGAAGCATMLPAGWTQSISDHMVAVSTVADDVIYEGDATDPTILALQNIGNWGAAAYIKAYRPGEDKEYPMQLGASAAEGYAQTVYRDLLAGRTLGGLVAETCGTQSIGGVKVVDADQVLGLVCAAVLRKNARQSELRKLEMGPMLPGDSC
jgi:hypothetical protein